MFIPTYKWGQTETHVVITVDAASIESHSVYPDGRCEIHGQVAGKGPFALRLELYGGIVADAAQTSVTPRCIRLKVPKAEPGSKWKMLQKESIPRPAQEKKDFDFFEDSEASGSEDEESPDDEEMERLMRKDAAAREAIPPRPRPKMQEPGHRDALVGPFCQPDELDWLLFFTCLFHLYVCPYTKVEESFNMQAMHDFLFLRTDIPGYDHKEFTGVVPRTFLGSLATSLVVSPISMFFQASYAPKVTSMNVARAGLALISVACTSAFRWQLGRRFGTSVSVAYACVTIVQFHINFYASRALPNTFALALSNLAYSYLLRDDYRTCMCILGFTAAVFRFEIVILATPILAMAIVRKRLPLGKALVVGLWGVAAGVAGALLSVCVDSVFWGRFVWPEFEGFVFNAVLNKSHEWGTSPFHWYLTSAIPRCMLGTLVLMPSGLYYSERMRELIMPALAYLAIFSLLPHKELRFIIYLIPIFNTVAAEEVSRLWKQRDAGKLQKFMLRTATTVLVFSVIASYGFLNVSAKNYPGGDALENLHTMERANVTRRGLMPHVHIDVAAAQQGITRFQEESQNWTYYKTEGEHDMERYTHLVTDKPEVKGYNVVVKIMGFDLGSVFNAPSKKPKMVAKMFVHKRRDLDVAPPPLQESRNDKGNAASSHDDDEEEL